MSFTKQLRDWLNRVSHRGTPFLSIRCDEDGVTQISATGAEARLNWADITDIAAYKVDCLIVDQIRLLIGNRDVGTWLEVTEHDPGYSELLSYLPQRLLGCPPVEEWFLSVALPPFETRWTVIYSKGREASDPTPIP